MGQEIAQVKQILRQQMRAVLEELSQEERAELSYLLLRAGAVKVASPGAMTKIFGLKAHDGEYPLLRYTKVVEDTDLTPADEG